MPAAVLGAECPAGSQSTGADAVFGVAGCSLCPAGTANPKATTATDACKACTENKIAPAVGSDKCTPCKGNSTANAAATACGECWALKQLRPLQQHFFSGLATAAGHSRCVVENTIG